MQAGGGQDEDEAFGPLGDADVAVGAQGLGARLDVGHPEAADHAEQRQPGEDLVASAAHKPYQQAREDGRVGEPVQGGVEERPPGAGLPGGAGDRAVEHVEQREEGDDDGADVELPQGVEHQRADDDAGGPHERDRVRGDADAHEAAADGGEQSGGGGTQDSQHGLFIVVGFGSVSELQRLAAGLTSRSSSLPGLPGACRGCGRSSGRRPRRRRAGAGGAAVSRAATSTGGRC